MIVEHLSASAIKTFETCPKKFWSEYIKGIKPPVHPKTRIGSAAHQVIEKTINARINTPLDIDAHAPLFHVNQSAKDNDIAPENINDIIFLVNRAESLGYFDDLTHVVGCEIKLNFEISGFAFKGFMDRLDIIGETAYIHDIKTSAYKMEHEAEQWQTVMYSLGVRNAYKVNAVKFCYWELRHAVVKDDLLSIDVPKDSGADRLISAAKEIRDCPDDSNPKPSKLCRFCAHPNCMFKKIFGVR